MGIYFLSLREEGTSLSFNEMKVQALFFTEEFDRRVKFLTLLLARVTTCISARVLGLKTSQNTTNKSASESSSQ